MARKPRYPLSTRSRSLPTGTSAGRRSSGTTNVSPSITSSQNDGTSCRPPLQTVPPPGGSGGGGRDAPLGLPDGTYGSPYSEQIGVSGGLGPYTWTAASPLPAGLTFGSDGTVNGTPTTSGSFTFTVHVVDSIGDAGSAVVSLVIDKAPLSATVVGSDTYGGTGVSFSVSGYDGFVLGDGPSVVMNNLAGCTSSASGSVVGSYAGTISGCSGLSADNFSISVVDGGFTVNQAPLTATVTGSDTYGGTGVSFVVSKFTGFVSPDDASVLTGTLTSCTSSATGNGAGSYRAVGTISGCTGLSAEANYSISYADGEVHGRQGAVVGDGRGVRYVWRNRCQLLGERLRQVRAW